MNQIKLISLALIFFLVFVSFPIVQTVNANTTIYIRQDGSVEGTDKIQRDGTVYTFTGNLYKPLIVEKDEIVIDGAGHFLKGPYDESTQYGILVNRLGYVTIKNITIQNFLYGICINTSFEVEIVQSKLMNNLKGIFIEHSSYVAIRETEITDNQGDGIYVLTSSDVHMVENIIENNTVTGVSFFFSLGTSNSLTSSEISYNGIGLEITMNSSLRHYIGTNNFTHNKIGIDLKSFSNDIIFNNIEKNEVGIQVSGSNNQIYRNKFINNTKQVYDIAWDDPMQVSSVNIWYSRETGNYWSDYTGTDKTPYVIDENNQDPFPLNEPLEHSDDPWNPDNDYILLTIGGAAFLIIFMVAMVIVVFVLVKKRRNQK